MKLSDILNGVNFIGNIPEIDISDIVYDSRMANESTMFVALAGAVVDGHDYAFSAYDKGCRVFLLERQVGLPSDAVTIICDDTRVALSKASCNFFNNPSKELDVVGITGTKGKTTVTYMLHSIFDSCGIKSGVIGTVGAYWGDKSYPTVNTTPESYETQKILRMMADDGCKAVFMEASSLGIKQHRIDGIEYFAGVYMNLSPDHIGGAEHKSFEEYAYWKKQLFLRCKRGVFNGDDLYCRGLADEMPYETLTFGINEPCDFKADNIELVQDEFLGMKFDVTDNNGTEKFAVAIPGYFSVSNSLAAMAVASFFGIQKEKIRQALLTVKINGRMEKVPTDTNYHVFIDYAHNGLSIKNLADIIVQYKHNRIITLFGCPGGRAQLRRQEMGSVSGSFSDLTIITSDDPQFESQDDIADEISKYVAEQGGEYIKINDRREAIRYALSIAQKDDIILLLGKGNEEYMKINGKKVPFSEREVIKEYLEEN